MDIPGERFEEIVESHLATLGIEDLKAFIKINNNKINLIELYDCEAKSQSLHKRYLDIKEAFLKLYPDGLIDEKYLDLKTITTVK